MGSCFSKPTLTSTENEEILILEAKQHAKFFGLDGISDFYHDQIRNWNEFELHFALIGSNESGK